MHAELPWIKTKSLLAKVCTAVDKEINIENKMSKSYPRVVVLLRDARICIRAQMYVVFYLDQ